MSFPQYHANHVVQSIGYTIQKPLFPPQHDALENLTKKANLQQQTLTLTLFGKRSTDVIF